MSSRARIFAAVTLLIGCLASPFAWAQVQNLEAGKSASQLFAGTCNACHKSPRGLLKTVSPGSLSDFLREHYTTSGDMASQLAAYLISNGASDRQAKQGADKQGGTDQADRQGRKNRTQEAARPDDAPTAIDGGRQNRKRLTRPGEQPDDAKPNAPVQAAIERTPDGRKQRGRPGKPGVEEPSMANEPPKTEPGRDDKPKGDAIGNVGVRPDAGNVPGEAKSEPAKSEPARPDAAMIELPKDASGDKPVVSRRDPVPQVTPALAAPSAPVPAAASGMSSSEPVAPKPPAPAVPASEPPAVTASAPPPPPASGPPAPPISR